MKATGIIRRIDDLGRVVIPRELRRALKIKEGDPLEIFTTREGCIVLQKYSPLGEADWARIGSVLKNSILQSQYFAIYNRDLELQYRSANAQMFTDDGSSIDSAFLATIKYEGDSVGYIAFVDDEYEPSLAVKVASAMYGEMVE